MLYKYPRTVHLPWSPGGTRDDRRLANCDHLKGKDVVVTVKMDGENTSMYRDAIHARSLTTANHPSRTWVKGFWSSIRYDIPENWRICGENLFAVHSIKYEKLGNWFKVFNIWDENNNCLGFDETLEWCELLNLQHTDVLYEGPFDPEKIKDSWRPVMNGQESEGYVVRIRAGFPYKTFNKCVAKMVRECHVKTDQHWMRKAVEENGLK